MLRMGILRIRCWDNHMLWHALNYNKNYLSSDSYINAFFMWLGFYPVPGWIRIVIEDNHGLSLWWPNFGPLFSQLILIATVGDYAATERIIKRNTWPYAKKIVMTFQKRRSVLQWIDWAETCWWYRREGRNRHKSTISWEFILFC